MLKNQFLIGTLILYNFLFSTNITKTSVLRKCILSYIVIDTENITSYTVVYAIYFFFILPSVEYTILFTLFDDEVHQYL